MSSHEPIVAQARMFLSLYYRLLGPRNVAVEVDGSNRLLDSETQATLLRILKMAQSVHASRTRNQAQAALIVRFGKEASHMNEKTHTLVIYIPNTGARLKQYLTYALILLISVLIVRFLLRCVQN